MFSTAKHDNLNSLKATWPKRRVQNPHTTPRSSADWETGWSPTTLASHARPTLLKPNIVSIDGFRDGARSNLRDGGSSGRVSFRRGFSSKRNCKSLNFLQQNYYFLVPFIISVIGFVDYNIHIAESTVWERSWLAPNWTGTYFVFFVLFASDFLCFILPPIFRYE